IVGKMPLEERLVGGDVLDADDGFVGPVVLGPVHQQEGIAVRDAPQNLRVVDGNTLGLTHHPVPCCPCLAKPPVWPARPSRARTAATAWRDIPTRFRPPERRTARRP